MKRMIAFKTLVAAAVLTCSVSLRAVAQFKKGTVMMGTTVGTTAYSSANSDYDFDNGNTRSTGTKTYTFGIGPQIGVFISPNVVVGGSLTINLNNTKVNTVNDNTNYTSTGTKTNTTTTTVSLGPFLRYYFAQVKGNNWFYTQVNGSVGTGGGSSSGSSFATTTTNTTTGKVSDILNWNAGGSIGMTHFIDKHIGMDFSLGYTYTHAHSDNDNTTYTTNKSSGALTASTNNYTLGTTTNGVTLGVGFHWFL
jgi:hypothetical protein